MSDRLYYSTLTEDDFYEILSKATINEKFAVVVRKLSGSFVVVNDIVYCYDLETVTFRAYQNLKADARMRAIVNDFVQVTLYIYSDCHYVNC